MPDKKQACKEYKSCPGIDIVNTTISGLYDKHNAIHEAIKDTNLALLRKDEKHEKIQSKQFKIYAFILTTLIGLFGLNSVELRLQRIAQREQSEKLTEQSGKLVMAIQNDKLIFGRMGLVEREMKSHHDFYVNEMEKMKKYIRFNAMAVGTKVPIEF